MCFGGAWVSTRVVTAALVLLLAAGGTEGSETGQSGAEGHPRSRFPLAVYVTPAADPRLEAAVRRATDDWNVLSQELLGLPVFGRAGRPEDAQVVIRLEAGPSPKQMGETELHFGEGGVITLPVRIALSAPSAWGQTAAETLLYQVAAHELGHALGLEHATDPRSLMCCVRGSVDFNDPLARQAYVDARRRPDIRSVAPQLRAHYDRFWSR